jgi:hypothetical protein
MSKFKLEDLTGQRFGRLVAVEPAQKTAGGTYRWKCACDCGNTCDVATGKLKRGITKSCGCYRVDAKKLPPGEAALKRIVTAYRRNAEKRGLAWNLTDDQIHALVTGNCEYCDAPPTNRMKSSAVVYTYTFDYNGIDRIDNTVGYAPDNVITCCKTCNWAKGQMTNEEFREWAVRLYRKLCG